jgi:hypothetical protein
MASLLARAVVKKAGKLSDSPDELAVMLTPFAVRAVFNPMASLLALAVVRYAPGACAVVKNAGKAMLNPLVELVAFTSVPAVVVLVNPVPARREEPKSIVICVLPDIPKVAPLELAKIIVPLVAVWVPAPIAAIPAAAPGTTVAVIIPATSIPKEMPLEFENTTVPVFCELVPALIAAPPAPPAGGYSGIRSTHQQGQHQKK